MTKLQIGDQKVQKLVTWISENAFLNADCIKFDTSTEKCTVIPSCNLDDQFGLELYIVPKTNIISFANSTIINLLNDYNETCSDDDKLEDEVSQLILTLIYEISLGENSPWNSYFESLQLDQYQIPICLWDNKYKKSLKNTRYDLYNVLDATNLTTLYAKCIKFGISIDSYIKLPNLLHESDKNLIGFSKLLNYALTNCIYVDKYHSYSIVPGSELFLTNKWNVELDTVPESCEQCGENDCDHEEEEEEEEEEGEEDEEEEGEEEEEEEEEEEKEEYYLSEDNKDNESEEEIDFESHLEKLTAGVVDEDLNDWEMQSSDNSDNEEACAGGCEHDHSNVSEEDEQTSEIQDTEDTEEPLKEITMEFIEKLERDLLSDDEENDSLSEEEDAEVNQDNEGSESSLDLSEDEITDSQLFIQEEIQNEIEKNQCIVFKYVDYNPEHKFEESDPNKSILFQRYGFSEGTDIHSYCLCVPVLQYLKKLGKGKKELTELKLDWFENLGYELIQSILKVQSESCEDEDCDDEECNEEAYDEAIFNDSENNAWELEITVNENGTPSIITYALMKLILIPFKIFQNKFIDCSSEHRIMKRIQKFLLPNDRKNCSSRIESKMLDLFHSWCRSSLNQYNEVLEDDKTTECAFVKNVISKEKEILTKGSQTKILLDRES